MKKFALFGIILIIAGFTYMYKNDILTEYYDYFVKRTKIVKLDDKNEYYRDYDFEYVQRTDNFSPTNRQDIMNIIYSVLNAGKEKFTFYCPKEYETCIEDVKEIANDRVLLSNINNYVHPFNSFSNIATQTDSLGTVTLKITKAYTNNDIEMISEAVESIEQEIFDSNLSTEDQIKKVHNYIIENSKYDSNRTDNNVIEYKSDIAYGPLIEGYGICGGYSDAMQLFLEDLDIKSFKVASDSHIWNAINLYDNWYHIDLTWDDPVTNTGEDVLDDSFFLITTNELLNKESLQHTFDLEAYKEVA